MAAPKLRIGFVGLGNMGGPMAQNLRRAGNHLQVFDLNKAAVEVLVALGCEPAASPRQAAHNADVVVTMLPANAHVLDAYLNPDSGILAGAKPGSLLIDSSTVNPSVSQQVSKAAADKRMRFCDAPVSGGVGGAAAGTLTFMVGASGADFESAKPVLSLMGKNLVLCGDVGAGEVAKICVRGRAVRARAGRLTPRQLPEQNNMLLAITMIGTAEAMNLGVRLGMDRSKLASVLNTSSGRCWSSEVYNPAPGVLPNVPSSKDYEGGFGTALMNKDVGLALDAARSVGAPVPLGSASSAVYETLCANGLGKKDFSVVYRFLGGK
jgi:3-hydroxyisobutyrate dehydrogenase